jgi:hypothetical protein
VREEVGAQEASTQTAVELRGRRHFALTAMGECLKVCAQSAQHEKHFVFTDVSVESQRVYSFCAKQGCIIALR